MLNLEPGAQITPSVRLVRPLGSGGMGKVWVGEHSGLRTEVAVKFIDREKITDAQLGRFSREAALAAKLKHPHVVQMFDHGTTEDGAPYIVMELLEGECLSDRLQRDGRVSLHEARLLVSQVCKVLSRAHSLGIIHRDLKPPNLFLVDTGYELFVKVLDFGVAKQFDGDDVQFTSTHGVVGTPHYMSLEALRGGIQLDGRADLWALSVIAYRVLTGELPFPGESFGDQTLLAHEGHFTKASELRDELPAAVDAFFATAFARNIDDRHQDARQLATAFREALGVSSLSDSEPAESSRFPQALLRSPAPVAAADKQETLEGAASQTVAGVKRPRHWLWAAVAAPAIAAGVLALRASEAPAPTTPPTPPAESVSPASEAPPDVTSAPTPAEASAAPAATVMLVIDSVPPNVEVKRGEDVLGKAPGPLQLDRSEAAIDLRFSADGYQPDTLHVTPSKDQTLRVRLKRAVRAPRPSEGTEW